ncbi:hypothetical protein OSB04_012131, partial [Centaurea solstitialis]
MATTMVIISPNTLLVRKQAEQMNTTNGNEHQINMVSTVSHNQPSQLPPSNLPSRDLLDRGEDFKAICIPLYNALTTNDFKVAKVIIDKRPELVQFSITESCETVLHIAVVLRKSCMFVQYLMSLMTKDDLELSNGNGETSLCVVATTENVEIAKILVEKNDGLMDIPNSQGKVPLQVAALHGRHDMVVYLYSISQKMTSQFWTHQNRSWVFEECVSYSLFDVALRMVTDLPELATNGSVLRLLAQKPYYFNRLQFGRLFRVKNLLKGAMAFRFDYHWKGDDVIQLLGIILTEVMKLPKAEIDNLIRGPPDETTTTNEDAKYSSRLLFLAAEKGNTRFIVEVIRQYPHLALEVNDDNQSIFHVAISRRYKDIYKLLHEKDHIRNSIVTLEDKNGNNMLHLVGESARPKGLGMISSLQLDTEYTWFKTVQHTLIAHKQDDSGFAPAKFHRMKQTWWLSKRKLPSTFPMGGFPNKEVKRMLPDYIKVKKNIAGVTASDKFFKKLDDIYFKERELMKQMATQLMVVEALIATISFAALFTFPGGYDQKTGTPILLGEPISKLFLIFDSLSFLSSTTSIVTVLYTIFMDDFASSRSISSVQVSFCLKLALFSLITIIVSFLINIFILCQNIHKNSVSWLPIFTIFPAEMPLVLLGLL